MAGTVRTAVRVLTGIGLVAAAAIGPVTVVAVAQGVPVELEITADEEVAGAPGDRIAISAIFTNQGPAVMAGMTIDFVVPDGATVMGILGEELVDGTERPDDGCALLTPRHLGCRYPGTLDPWLSTLIRFDVRLAHDATPGELGVATVTIEGDNALPATAGTRITVTEAAPEVVLDAALEPAGILAPPGAVVDLTARTTNTGTADMTGGTVDFEVPDGVTVTGIVGEELVDGTERPDEGCALVTPRRVECHTNATLAAGDSAAATFRLQLPDSGYDTHLGEALLRVAGDNGGEATAEASIVLGPPEGHRVNVSVPAEVAGAAGDVVEIVMDAMNVGGEDVVGRTVELEVPTGASIAGVEGIELSDDPLPPAEGCRLLTPRKVWCHTSASLAAYDGTERVTFLVRLDGDAPAGELGVAALTYTGDNGGSDAGKTVLTVTAAGDDDGGGDGGDDGTGESGGDEAGGDGEELPDTGVSSSTVVAAALGLLLAGAVVTLRARRA